MSDTWSVAGRTFTSRLIVGTGYLGYTAARQWGKSAGSEK
jgi:thiazole synthase ThiGH ThiG subunit